MITTIQMEIISRAEVYGEGRLYRRGSGWSELAPGKSGIDAWRASNQAIAALVRAGLAVRLDADTIKITAP